MPHLHVTELMEGGAEPAIAEQVFQLGQEPAQSKPFDKRTRVLRIMADADCAVSIGAEPVATRASGMLAAKQEQVRQLAGGGMRLSAVLLVNDATLNIASSVEGLIALITNHEAASRRLRDLKALSDSSSKLLAQAQKIEGEQARKDAAWQAADADLQKRSREFRTLSESTAHDLRLHEETMQRERKQFEEDFASYVKDRTEWQSGIAKREEVLAVRERQLSAKEKIVEEATQQFSRLSQSMATG